MSSDRDNLRTLTSPLSDLSASIDASHVMELKCVLLEYLNRVEQLQVTNIQILNRWHEQSVFLLSVNKTCETLSDLVSKLGDSVDSLAEDVDRNTDKIEELKGALAENRARFDSVMQMRFVSPQGSRKPPIRKAPMVPTQVEDPSFDNARIETRYGSKSWWRESYYQKPMAEIFDPVFLDLYSQAEANWRADRLDDEQQIKDGWPSSEKARFQALAASHWAHVHRAQCEKKPAS